MGQVLVTGNSSGLGLGLTEAHLARGDAVHGISRRGCRLQHERLSDTRCDLADLQALPGRLGPLLADLGDLDRAYLNAGVLGPIADLSATGLETLKSIMDINLWANKLILDALIGSPGRVGQVVLISSGAAVNGNRGWGGYALSKATLNMLAQLYAHEMPDSHLVALAPGLVDTAMQEALCGGGVDTDRFPSVKRLIEARGTEAMPDPGSLAERLVALLPILDCPSGAFVDLRDL